ncbi:hypothetical protein R1flu_017911 [Riccia fluitans]|uniref:Uncharacterized protein n=1 Tax=Riccia fluitans TaxID=41844 RepID=A0ABD1ZED7_9MARC
MDWGWCVSTAVSYDHTLKAIRVKVPGTDEEFYLHPATVRRNDRSAQSIDEWTGEQRLKYGDIAEDIEPESIQPMGNYAVAINCPGGFSQIAPYEQLQSLERLVDVPGEDSEERAESQAGKDEDGEQELVSQDKQAESSNAVSILQHASALQGSRTSKC